MIKKYSVILADNQNDAEAIVASLQNRLEDKIWIQIIDRYNGYVYWEHNKYGEA